LSAGAALACAALCAAAGAQAAALARLVAASAATPRILTTRVMMVLSISVYDL
jgi:hypothetical protein